MNLFTCLIVSIVAFSGILFGFDTGIIASVLEPVIAHFQLTTIQTEVVVSAVLFGALLGACLSGKITDLYGRRTILFTAAICFIIGTLTSALAINVMMLIIGRVVIGLAIGMTSLTAPLYISEVAPPAHRGSLVILNTVMVTFGIVIAYGFPFVFPTIIAWRLMLGIGIIPAVFMGVGLLFLPPSPRWLIKSGKKKQAHAVLSRIRQTSTIAQREANAIQQIVSQEKHYKRYSLFQLLCSHFRPILLLGLILAVIQQVTGINVMLYYAPIVMQMIGLKLFWAKTLGTMGLGLTNFLMTIIALFLVDKLGRRFLLLLGLIGMTISLTIIAIGLSDSSSAIFHWTSLTALILFVAFYALSIGCLFWLLIAEVYPLNIRGQAMGIAAAANWAANFIVAITFLSLVQHLGMQWTFGLYASISLLSLIFCYYFVPETKQISLEGIEKRLLAHEPLRRLGE